MEARYKCCAEDYVEAQRAHSAKMRRAILIGGLVLIPIAAWEIWTIGLAKTAPALLLALFVFTIPFMAVSGRRLRRDFKNHPNLSREYLLRVGDDGLEMVCDVCQSQGTWTSYTSFRETPNLFMIYCGARMFFMVPKRALTLAQVDEFRRLVRQKLPAK